MGKKPGGREVTAALEVSAVAELALAEDSVMTEVRYPLVAAVDVASAPAVSFLAVSVADASVVVVSSATELVEAGSSATAVLEASRLDNSAVDIAAEVTSVD